MESPHSILKKVFGYDSFRPGQEEIVSRLLAGQDVLAVMPTGAGKSICYQVPALLLPGITIVVSPLVSLMKDQVGALVQAGVAAAFLNNSLTDNQKALMLRRAREGWYHITDATIKAVSDLFRKEGSDAWYKYEAEQIIPAGEVCEKCGASEWTKDTDIMDVWFDSGSTHAAVLEERPELHFPADMYMEGGDQFRGWFQSSLLTSVASKGCAPYKSVLCHGWVVDEQGKQMHKSAGNGVEPSEIIKDYGADIIRLWVASSDYTVDVRAGKNIFKQLSEAYLKIRNTARFILGNLDGFDPNTDCVADDQLQELDRWALAALDDLIVNAKAGYDVYDFNKVYHAVYNFCVVAMSNFYLDVTKDRLYCTNGVGRKAAQTTMYKILVALDKIIAPILCFTSQEIWDFLPKTEGMNKYVVFEAMPKAGQYAADDAFKAKWTQLIAVRDEVKKVLEQARAEKTIGASLEASVTLYCNDAVYDLLQIR